MGLFFEYLYYRICKAFFKWDGVEGNRGIWAVTMVQTLTVFDLILTFFSLLRGRSSLFSYSTILGMSAVVILFIVMFLNGRKYDGRYQEFDARWKDEPENKKILKGFLVLLVMVVPWIGLFLISKLK